MASSSRNQTKFTNKLKDKKVLILGGTSGIGFACAEACIEFGAHVVVSSSTSDKVEKAQQRLKEAYPDYADNIRGMTCDLSKAESLESNLRALLDFTGKGIHHIVHTAGTFSKLTPVREATPEILQNLAVLRFTNLLILAKVAPDYLAGGPESSITFTGGVNTARPQPDWTINASYGAGKEGMVRGLAIDLKPVRVNLVMLGAVETELWDSMPEEQRKGLFEMARKATTTGQLGRPEDVAEAYLYCMKDNFVTGTMISTDGGRLLV